MSRAPVETGLRHNDPSSMVTSPHWLQWFQQSFDRLMVSFNGRYGAVVPQTGDYTAAQVGADAAGTAAAGDATHLGVYDHTAIAHTNRAALDAVAGTNTGDQDLSGLEPAGTAATGDAAHLLAFDHDAIAGKQDAITAGVYADNAAALVGGLVAGQMYRTATGVVMIVY